MRRKRHLRYWLEPGQGYWWAGRRVVPIGSGEARSSARDIMTARKAFAVFLGMPPGSRMIRMDSNHGGRWQEWTLPPAAP